MMHDVRHERHTRGDLDRHLHIVAIRRASQQGDAIAGRHEPCDPADALLVECTTVPQRLRGRQRGEIGGLGGTGAADERIARRRDDGEQHTDRHRQACGKHRARTTVATDEPTAPARGSDGRLQYELIFVTSIVMVMVQTVHGSTPDAVAVTDTGSMLSGSGITGQRTEAVTTPSR